MRDDLVDVLLRRPTTLGGVERAAAETLRVPASTAATMIASGRARLVDASDLGLIVDGITRIEPSKASDRPRLFER